MIVGREKTGCRGIGGGMLCEVEVVYNAMVTRWNAMRAEGVERLRRATGVGRRWRCYPDLSANVSALGM